MRIAEVAHNPIAGKGRAGKLAADVSRVLRERDWVVRDHSAERGRGDSPAADVLIVIGGDGTLRHVVGGMIRREMDVPRVLPLQMGTANLMAEHLKLPSGGSINLDQIAELLDAPGTLSVDVASANDVPFFLIASVGFDATVVHDVARNRRGPISKATYVLPMVRSFTDFDPSPVRVWGDDELLFEDRPAMVVVANVSEYGLGFPLIPHAVDNDGLLDLMILPLGSRTEFLNWAARIAIGRHLDDSRAIVRKVKSARVETERKAEVQIDGDPAGFTPLDIRLLPRTVEFIVGN